MGRAPEDVAKTNPGVPDVSLEGAVRMRIASSRNCTGQVESYASSRTSITMELPAAVRAHDGNA